MWCALGRWALTGICLMLSACSGAPRDRLEQPMPTALSVSDLRLTTTPAEASTSAIAKAPPVTIPIKQATPTATLDATQIMVHGKVYDAELGRDQRFTDATLDCHVTALDWQTHNCRISAPDGIYQLSLMVRPDDE